MNRIAAHLDTDGALTIEVEIDDLVPGAELQPWLEAWLRCVQSSLRDTEVPEQVYARDGTGNLVKKLDMSTDNEIE